MFRLNIVFHEAEGSFLKFFFGIFGEQGAVVALQALDGNNDQTAVLLGELDDLQVLGNVQIQAIVLIDTLQQFPLLGFRRNNDAVFLEQVFQLVDRDIFPCDCSLANARKHGVGKRKADINLIAGLRITHNKYLLKKDETQVNF